MADELIAMFASITTSDHDALVAQFSKVLQIEPNVAQFFLESSSWNVETAINTFLASVGTKANLLNVTTHPAAVITCQPEFASGGEKVPPCARRTVMIHLKNTGTVAWPSDTRLGFCDGTQLTSSKLVRVPCLDPGQEQFFNLEITTPREPGSYASSYRLGFGGGYISEPMWAMLTVDAALAAPAAAAPTTAPIVTHPHDPLMGLGGSSVGTRMSDMAMDSSPPPAAATAAAVSASLFAPTSFAAPAMAPAAPAATETAQPAAFQWTGFRSAPAATGGGPGSGGGVPVSGGFGGGGFGAGGFGFAPAAASAPMAAPTHATATGAHGGAAASGGGGGDGDDMMMDL